MRTEAYIPHKEDRQYLAYLADPLFLVKCLVVTVTWTVDKPWRGYLGLQRWNLRLRFVFE